MRSALVIAVCMCACRSEPPRPALDVPTLATVSGTIEPAEAAIILTGAHDEVAAQRATIPERGPAVVAIRPDLTLQAVTPGFDAICKAGVSDLGLLVRVGNQRRMVLIDGRIAANDGPSLSIAIVSARNELRLGDQPIAIDALRAELSRARPSRIVIDAAPDLTIQRLAEVIAASGGHAFVGTPTLPTVVPPTAPPATPREDHR